jgi:membrane protein YqaA with SNARE-associated domain
MQYILLFLVVFGVNLLPAFGPPTWTLLVFARITWHLEPVALVLIGAVAAMAGRYVLASGARRLRGHLGAKRRADLEAANQLLFQRRGRAWAVLALFAVSPLPSAQLFVAAGLLDVALVPLTLAFMVGRLVSYSFYVALATLADRQLGSVLRHALGSPWSIALQLALLAAAAVGFCVVGTSASDGRERRPAPLGETGGIGDRPGQDGRGTASDRGGHRCTAPNY